MSGCGHAIGMPRDPRAREDAHLSRRELYLVDALIGRTREQGEGIVAAQCDAVYE